MAVMSPKIFAALAATLVLVSSLVGCVVGLRNFGAEDARVPQRLSALAGDPSDRLDIDATVVGIDPQHAQVRVQLAFHPQGRYARSGTREMAEDIELDTNATQGAQLLALRKGQTAHGTEIVLDLTEGDIAWYPLDRYRAALELEARTTGASAAPVPLRVNFLSRQHMLHVEAGLEPDSTPGEADVSMWLTRPGVTLGFAWFMHALMLVVAASSFIVAYNIGFRNKKPEGTLLVWMSALLFVLPAFRNMLPGGPPLGVLSDYLVFFWVEGLVACCLLVVVLSWARRGTAG